MKKNGFTLIELVVVIALIAILAVTLAPRLRDQIAKANDAKAIATLGALRTNAEVFFAEREESVVEAHTAGTATTAAEYVNAMGQLVGELDNSTLNLFNDGNGFSTALAYTTTGLVNNAAAGELLVPVGGSRTSATANVNYGGTIGFAFAQADGTIGANPDGVSLALANTGITGDYVPQAGSAGAFDTKRKSWASY